MEEGFGAGADGVGDASRVSPVPESCWKNQGRPCVQVLKDRRAN
jgi:hypothetical protein